MKTFSGNLSSSSSVTSCKILYSLPPGRKKIDVQRSVFSELAKFDPEKTARRYEFKKLKISSFLRQYLSIKQKHEESIVLYRVGPAYVMFFEDAIIAAKMFGLYVLPYTDGEKIPFCDIPADQVDKYICKLTSKGLGVVQCDENEPGKWGINKIFSPGVRCIHGGGA